MGNRHYIGRGQTDPPTLDASWWRIAFSWIVAIAFVLAVGPVTVEGNKAGAFVVFVLLFPVLLLLMLGIVGMGLLALLNAVRGRGPGAGNLMFWLEILPAAIGVLAGLSYWATLKAPW